MTSALISISYHIQMSALGQLEFGISACRHLVASGAVGRRAAAIACDDALLLARDVAIDPGHPRIDLIGEQARPERLDVLGPGLHTGGGGFEARKAGPLRKADQARHPIDAIFDAARNVAERRMRSH